MSDKEKDRNVTTFLKNFEKDSMFIERFIYDVLAYTLTKCGLPETSLPTTQWEDNVYHRENLVKIAGASVLRISLTMRDKWKRMFMSRSKSKGFSDKEILDFVAKLSRCYRLSRTCRTQSLVELLLASCSEIMLYFHLENIVINFNKLIRLIGGYIIVTTGLSRNDPEKLEKLFDSFDDICGYTEWITDFITRFAIPYGSRDDVSDLFFERVKEKFEEDLKKLTDSLRFLPCDLFSAITDAPRSEKSDKSTSVPSGSQSAETPNLPKGSETGAVGGKESIESLSTRTENVSEHCAESKRSSEISSDVGIEQDLEKMSLDAKETSQEIHGAKAKRKVSKNEKNIGKKKGC